MVVQFKKFFGNTGYFGAILLLTFGVFFSAIKTGYAMKIQEITTPGGIKALLIEEHTIPLMAMRFSFSGGATQDDVGKEGTANLLSVLLDEGAGDMKSSAFLAILDELAIRISFSASRDEFSGSFQTLTKNRDKAVDLLNLALTKPRFDADAVERMREELLTSLKFAQKSPDSVASKNWFETAYKDHPYGRMTKGSPESVAKVTKEDLATFVKKNFARDNLTVAVVGDIDAKTLSGVLDKIFGSLPKAAELKTIEEAKPVLGPVRKVIEMDIPQSVAIFGYQGLKRDDKDFVPAYVLNYIFGGGGFASRLTEQVREKRGLAYSVYSYLYPLDHSALFMGGVATKNESLNKSISVIQDEIKLMADKGPTEEELKNAKLYLTGSYPLRFDTSSKIANQLMRIQIDKLGLDYFDKRNSLIEAVSMEDIRKVAKRLFKSDKLITVIVGKPS